MGNSKKIQNSTAYGITDAERKALDVPINVVKEREIIKTIRAPYKLSFIKDDRNLYVDADSNKPCEDKEPNHIPIICILNGAGRNGKDTFANLVGSHCKSMDITTISETMDVVDYMIHKFSISISKESDMMHITKKDDYYRGLLNSIKMAWSKFNNGPNANICYKVYNDTIANINAGLSPYDIIFINNRDYHEIVNMKEIFNELGYCVISLMVVGRIDPSVYNNGCDEHVEDYKHDFYIYNTGTEDELDLKACVFSNRVMYANKGFGVTYEDFSHINELAKDNYNMIIH